MSPHRNVRRPITVQNPRIALVHDWLTGMRGGERTLEAICELYPAATRFALLHVHGSVSKTIEAPGIRTSFIQKMPLSQHYYRALLPLFPTAIEQLNLDDFDLIISTSHCVAKSIIVPGRARHLCYCFTPMRYAWDQFPEYFGPDRTGPLRTRLLRQGLSLMARWDASTAYRPDRYIAISQYVSGRIKRYYNREARVIHPPVDTDFFRPGPGPIESYCLVVSALVPYKRIDLAISACALAGVPLRIVGNGPDLSRLQAISGPDVTFFGSLSDEQVRSLYQRATAVLLPGTEDFGIAPVEAQACGRPVIALNAGGACETVSPKDTGILVAEPSASAFADAIARVPSMQFKTTTIREHAIRYSRTRFKTAMQREIAQLMTTPLCESSNDAT